MSLVPLHQYKGSRVKKLPLHIEMMIRDSLVQEYLVDRRPSLKQVYANTIGRVKDDQSFPEHDKYYPSVRTMYRRAKELDPYVVASMRYGQRHADAQFRAAGASFQATRLMELVMMDGHKMDVILVDEDTGKSGASPIWYVFLMWRLGRLWVGILVFCHFAQPPRLRRLKTCAAAIRRRNQAVSPNV